MCVLLGGYPGHVPLRPAVPGVVKHQLMYLWRGQVLVTTLHVQHAQPVTQAMVDADRAQIRAWAQTDMGNRWPTTCQLQQIKSWDLSTAPPAKFPNNDIVPAITGSQNEVSRPMPTLLTYAVSLRTGVAGAGTKSLSGRIYHVGILPDDVNGNDLVVTASRLTAYNALLNRLDAPDGLIGQLVVVSYRANKAWRLVPLVMPVTHMYIEGTLDVQRRRKPRQQSFATN